MDAEKANDGYPFLEGLFGFSEITKQNISFTFLLLILL